MNLPDPTAIALNAMRWLVKNGRAPDEAAEWHMANGWPPTFTADAVYRVAVPADWTKEPAGDSVWAGSMQRWFDPEASYVWAFVASPFGGVWLVHLAGVEANEN